MTLQKVLVSESGINYCSRKMIGYNMKTTNNAFTNSEEKGLSQCQETVASGNNGAANNATVFTTDCNILVPV